MAHGGQKGKAIRARRLKTKQNLVYAREDYYAFLRRKEVLVHAATCTDLQITPSEIAGHRKTDAVWFRLHADLEESNAGMQGTGARRGGSGEGAGEGGERAAV